MIEQIKLSYSLLAQQKPLVLCLTNYVTMDFMANALLAVKAAPLMSESIDELEELINISHAVYINIGTLNTHFIERALFATQIAHSLGKPIILDPVGAGASKLRTDNAIKLLQLANVVRGNASEIISLTGADGATKGVESSHAVEHATSMAKNTAKKHNQTIVISGPEDFITNGQEELRVPFGSPLMPLITGMGCTLTAVVSAFVAIHKNHFQAACDAVAFFGLCGQLANQKAIAPGSFKELFLDTLFDPNWDAFTSMYEKIKANK